MNALVVSNSFVVKTAMYAVLNKNFKDWNVKTFDGIKDIQEEEAKKTGFVFVDVESDVLENIDVIEEELNNAKVMVFDKSSDANKFKKLYHVGIDGYVVDRVEEDDIVYIVNKLIKGKKYYDSELIENIFLEDSVDKGKKKNSEFKEKLSLLTKREIEVLEKVGKGLTNKEISNQLYITEYTIKKHITNILSKFDMKNRKELIYMSYNTEKVM